MCAILGRIIITLPGEMKAVMVEGFDNWKVYNCSLVMTYSVSLFAVKGSGAALNNLGGSFVYWVCVPDVLNSIGLDFRRSTIEAHTWWGAFMLTPHFVHQSADMGSIL